MRVAGIDGLTTEQLAEELNEGGRFVFYEYCISCLVFTLRRPTDIIFLRSDQRGWVRGLPYTMLSAILGWWGLPWGVIYTPLALATNLAGGCDVTEETCDWLGLSAEDDA
jgi:hypothetical protein